MTKLEKHKLIDGIRLAAVHLQALEKLLAQIKEVVDKLGGQNGG